MSTIRSITFSDFKKFTRYGVSCKSGNILVGPNNAGKSSILDALRLIADLMRATRREGPTIRDQAHHGVCASYNLTLNSLSIPLENTVRDYGDEPASIVYALDNGRGLHFRLHPDSGVQAFLTGADKLPRTGVAFRTELGLDVIVVPTLSALDAREERVKDETARRNESTRLASRTFRNIVDRLDDAEFLSFSEYCKLGWPKVEINRPEIVRGQPAHMIMMYSEKRIEREVHWSGFGYQVWMQIMLQFQRAAPGSILVLDEPDIYLHPDLQRKLLSIVRNRFSQFFVATHSTEIINDADPGEVLMIDSSGRSARRISSDESYKKVYAYLGSSENAEFSRLAKAERIVFFEGKERNLVRKIAKKLGVHELFDDPRTVYLQAGGYAQWRRIKEVNWTLHEVLGLDAKIAALFDRDYRCDEDVGEFEHKMTSDELWARVLRRKEIENYALSVPSLVRTILDRARARDVEIGEDEALAIIDDTVALLTGDVRAQRAAMYLSHMKDHQKNVDEATKLKTFWAQFDEGWASLDGRLAMIPGKEFISSLSARLQRDHGFSITVYQLIDEMTVEEIDPEIAGKLEEMADFFL